MRSAEERITVKDGLSHLKYPFLKPQQTIKVPNVTCLWWMWKGWRRLEKSAMEAAFLWWCNLRWPLFRLMMLHRDYMKWLLELLPKVSGTDVACVTESTRSAFKRALLQAVFHDCCRLWVLSYRLMWGNIRTNGVKDIGDVGNSQKCSSAREEEGY